MMHLPPRLRIVAASMAFVAGFVDAIGFTHLGGYFVSFMSGNSTRLGVGIPVDAVSALVPMLLVMLFVAGVVLGALVPRQRADGRVDFLLFTIACILAAAAALASGGRDSLAIFLTPIAMGAMNTMFQRNGEVAVGVTYMTGTLVKLGQRLAAALAGGSKWAWMPYLLLWLALVLGAVCGVAGYFRFGLNALWLPSAGLLALSITAPQARIGQDAAGG